jgi:hypothetical protein
LRKEATTTAVVICDHVHLLPQYCNTNRLVHRRAATAAGDASTATTASSPAVHQPADRSEYGEFEYGGLPVEPAVFVIMLGFNIFRVRFRSSGIFRDQCGIPPISSVGLTWVGSHHRVEAVGWIQ